MKLIELLMVSLVLFFAAISKGDSPQASDSLEQPRLLSAIAQSTLDDNRMFFLKREFVHTPAEHGNSEQQWLKYSILRESVIDANPLNKQDSIWAKTWIFIADQPILWPDFKVAMDLDLRSEFVYVAIVWHTFPATRVQVYKISANAHHISETVRKWDGTESILPQGVQGVDPFAEYISNDIHMKCGIERVRIVVGREQLHIFLTRVESDCGEQQLQYNLNDDEWMPAPSPPLVPTEQLREPELQPR